jgi:RNA polymerase sigma-70 factor (ECF subfamily)
MQPNNLAPTRHSLLRRLKNWEDQTSWEQFFNTYQNLIYDAALKAGLSESEAQDVVQETVVTVAKKIKDFEADPKRGSFKSWLLQTVNWRIADQFRKRLRSVGEAVTIEPRKSWGAPGPDDGSQTSIAHRVPDPRSIDLDTIWEEGWRKNLVDVAMSTLKNEMDPLKFQLFDLHVLRGQRARQVAERLGVKTGQVYLASYWASRRLKKEIKRLRSRLE